MLTTEKEKTHHAVKDYTKAMITRFLFVFLLVLALCSVDGADGLTFAVVPKSTASPYFQQASRGCEEAAKELNVTCLFVGKNDPYANSTDQVKVISNLLQNNNTQRIHGMAIAVSDEDAITPFINQAILSSKIPVVTFDSDAPNSNRIAYIGTDNLFFGTQIAKVLKQLRPQGGSFGIISFNNDNVKEREKAFRREVLENSNEKWEELDTSPSYPATYEEALNDTMNFAKLGPTAIALMLEGPMRKTDEWERIVDSHRDKDIVYVSGDGSSNQLDLLSRRKCHGLVGQLPYEMGYVAIQVLNELVLQNKSSLNQEYIGTNVVTHIQVPLVLPNLEVDTNRIGGLAVLGFILFALVAIASIGFIAWTFVNRNKQVVKASQPIFLILVALGALTMASCILPLSFDDSTTALGTTGICMSVPWLSFMGFSITFSALYSKTRRINRIFKKGQAFTRVQVKPHQVLIPAAVLVSANAIVLTCWTVLDPLTYVRANHAGLDGWNRVISTYGTCRSEHGYRYFVPLAILNLIVLVIANWQAYEARHTTSEFSESKYVTLAMVSMLQCGAMGIPVLFIVREEPQPFYVILVFMLFIVSMGVLLLIFAPKIRLQRKYSQATPEQQRKMMLISVRESHQHETTTRRTTTTTAVAKTSLPKEELTSSLSNETQ